MYSLKIYKDLLRSKSVVEKCLWWRNASVSKWLMRRTCNAKVQSSNLCGGFS